MVDHNSYKVLTNAFDRVGNTKSVYDFLEIARSYFPNDIVMLCDALKGRYPQYRDTIDNYLMLK